MTMLNSQTTFTVQDPVQELIQSVDLVLLPANTGSLDMRELHYPGDLLPPIIYEEPPDSWENFDSIPLTPRPMIVAEQTLQDTVLAAWPGYQKDNPVREIWKGANDVAIMPADFYRRLMEYFMNPPDPVSQGYITWWPKDRTSQGYNIVIECVRAGSPTSSTSAANTQANQQVSVFDLVAIRQGYVLGEVIFSFFIVGEAS
ncbi:MAG: hypothetical protein WB948_03215 [Desulfobaccales bacterium]|jgi:hypothetical protein